MVKLYPTSKSYTYSQGYLNDDVGGVGLRATRCLLLVAKWETLQFHGIYILHLVHNNVLTR